MSPALEAEMAHKEFAFFLLIPKPFADRSLLSGFVKIVPVRVIDQLFT